MGFGRWGGGGATSGGTTTGAGANGGNGGFPSQSELDRNFLDAEEELEEQFQQGGYDGQYQEGLEGEEGEEYEDEPLYPGIYRAMFAFEPEGTAEVGLEEDELVKVVGRGGGVGWAVVEVGWKASSGAGSGNENGDTGSGADKGGGVDVTLKDGRKVRHGLVPESYLEPVRLDGEEDEAV